jgi:hypothetical protein
VKSSYCIFAVRPKNFHFSSLKEIENQLRMLKKVLADNNMARTFALPKNGWQSELRKAKESQKIFESWEATARCS